jgi:hypothetical protein
VTSTTSAPTIQIQIEDFGGNFAMLRYGHSRPSANYFNSNLMVLNFVVLTLPIGFEPIVVDSADVFFYDK